jgi:hypothetical protein
VGGKTVATAQYSGPLSDETEIPQAQVQAVSPPPGGDGASEATSAEPGVKRKRRRRRKKKPIEGGEAAAPSVDPAPGAALTADAAASIAALAGGLLSHIDDREIPCIVDGCDNTWVWTSTEQIQAFGKPPPKRMCDQCRTIEDREVRCTVEGCRRTWIWDREAQLKHRTRLSRGGAESRDPTRRKKRRRRSDGGGPPRRMCEPCHAKLARLVERDTMCKVHGCTRTVKVERELQLKAWAALRTEDLEVDAPLAKKMCEVCRDFCRLHPDREVPCGRPGCDRTWTYKTGAQLQAFLAGRLEDPIRLCDTCAKGGFVDPSIGPMESTAPAADGSEIMPCVVPGCDRTWIWRPSQPLMPVSGDSELPWDRMCAEHRSRRAPAESIREETGTSERETTDEARGGEVTAVDSGPGDLEVSEIGMRPEDTEQTEHRIATVGEESGRRKTDRSSDEIGAESAEGRVELPASD